LLAICCEAAARLLIAICWMAAPACAAGARQFASKLQAFGSSAIACSFRIRLMPAGVAFDSAEGVGASLARDRLRSSRKTGHPKISDTPRATVCPDHPHKAAKPGHKKGPNRMIRACVK